MAMAYITVISNFDSGQILSVCSFLAQERLLAMLPECVLPGKGHHDLGIDIMQPYQ